MRNAILVITILNGILFCNAQNQEEKKKKIRSEIYAEFHKNTTECSRNVDAVTDVNGKTEFWRICYLLNGNRILQIESHRGSTYYQEIYFEKDGQLVYAKETENYIPKNNFIQKVWNCEFYVENGKLISIISLGHGKTEEEEWEPEVIFTMYEKRVAELGKIKR